MSLNNVEYIIVGLGNVGKEYEMTRHNVGFMVMDKLAEKYGFRFDKTKFNSYCTVTSISNKKILVMKPNTYMNRSGIAVIEAMQFYKIPIQNVIIVYDDTSLDVGKIRIRRSGSDGGHNGIKNIIYLAGANNFPRIKIGISNKPHPQYSLSDWVLGKFTADDMSHINSAVDVTCEAIENIISRGIDYAMNMYN